MPVYAYAYAAKDGTRTRISTVKSPGTALPLSGLVINLRSRHVPIHWYLTSAARVLPVPTSAPRAGA